MNTTNIFYFSLGIWLGFIIGAGLITFFHTRAIRKARRDAAMALMEAMEGKAEMMRQKHELLRQQHDLHYRPIRQTSGTIPTQ